MVATRTEVDATRAEELVTEAGRAGVRLFEVPTEAEQAKTTQSERSDA